MALLASCWLIVESFVVPHGFIKWFYLSFYIHPSFLVFCQLFLWFNDLLNLFIFLFLPLDLVFPFIARVVVFLFSYIRPITKDDVYYDALEPEHKSLQDCQVFVSSRKSTPATISRVFYTSGNEIVHRRCVKDSWLNQYLYSDHYNYTVSNFMYDVTNMSTYVQPDQHECTTPIPSTFLNHSVDGETEDSVISTPSNDPLILENMIQDDCVSPLSSLDVNDESSAAGDVLVHKAFLPSYCSTDAEDPFHNKYMSRVRFFDVLYHERLHGINAILNEHLRNPIIFDFMAPLTNYPIVWSGTARKRVLKSLEFDLEMINVAQSCLFWEALDHQYHKVESLSLSENCGNILFHHNISGKFQEIEILLIRFVENQRCESQKSLSITRKRLSFQSLLRIPNAAGFVHMEKENKMLGCIRPAQLLEAIDNCTKAFWLYIKTDDEKKPFWKYKGIWRAPPSVEDPQYLELLYNVLKDFHKKEIMLRGVEGKRKCWMRRKVKEVQAEEKRNIVVGMIDVRLVQRMLKMPLINRSHLKWCQDKLNNLDFKEDTVFRGPNTQLFPLP
ncbi:uncharacterized protein LOC121810399 [Salvia splendens]|uniref:uncharacterized protein LOC121810399 n=1 Tax=Salvia splendens TaxID=180675 RepID=UPI001104F2CF|nr:uncharacterized protein LOC121810399 [Salvia splendens]